MVWTEPDTWVADEIPPASEWNRRIRDQLRALTTWVAYTPTLLNGTLGNGTLVGDFIDAGDLVHGRALLTWGSTTSNSGQIHISAPTAFSTYGSEDAVGQARLFDSSVPSRVFRHVTLGGTAQLRTVTEGGTFTTGTNPFTFASGDLVEMYFRYRKA